MFRGESKLLLALKEFPDVSIESVEPPPAKVVTEPPSESAAPGIASNSVGTSSRSAMLKACFLAAGSDRLGADMDSPGHPTNRLPHVACANETIGFQVIIRHY